MLARTLSAAIVGVEGAPVRVEVDVAFGLPGLTIVGLAGSAVQEARERVRSALRNSGFEVPARRITVNLAPADLPKDGTGYDLAIAVGILGGSAQLPDDAKRAAERVALIGELALDGGLQPVTGAMALVDAARDAGVVEVIVPLANEIEAASVAGATVRPAGSLGEVVAHLAGMCSLAAARSAPAEDWRLPDDVPDLAQVAGQPVARRALEVAVAGRHSLALCGPPGVGKTLLLRSAAALMPPLGDDEALEVSRIYSVAGLVDRRAPLVRRRPFRAPHHTISTQALVGGGSRVRPGEASLAHRGALLLDETLHFRADALDALRQPLESGTVAIARVDGVLVLPARFMLLAAFNPCPCGWQNSGVRDCRCDEGTVRRYAGRLSGPLRDRLDVYVWMAQSPSVALAVDGAEPSRAVAARVAAAWERQLERQGVPNAELPIVGTVEQHGVSSVLLRALEHRRRRFALAPRRLHRTLRVARTIADLGGRAEVNEEDLNEALGYRPEQWT